MTKTHLLGIDLGKIPWFSRVTTVLAAGAVSRRLLRVPQADAQKLLRQVIRRVANLPRDASPTVVWHDDAGAELLVLTDRTTLVCASGLVTMRVTVQCDQTRGVVALPVPIGVGTAEAPAGLVMHTFSRLAGPEVVTDRWSEGVAAFAWEALLELARTLSAAVGKDSQGRPLIPGAIGAEPGVLLVQPMARHDARRKGTP